MTAPTQRVRQDTYERDGHRCVACGATGPLEWQHRQSSGHGGRGRKAPVLTTADGITLCTFCNTGAESHQQELALHMGWKVRRNTLLTCSEVPVFDRNTHSWWLLDTAGEREELLPAIAAELIEAAGGYVKKLERMGG